MAEYDLIQLHGDTNANTDFGMILADRELYIEKNTDGMYIKIGDGQTPYNALPYSVQPKVVVDNGTENPTSANAGQLFFRTDLGELYIYDGTAWKIANQPNILFPSGDTNPESPQDGQPFFRTDLHKLIVAYGDVWYDAAGNVVE